MHLFCTKMETMSRKMNQTSMGGIRMYQSSLLGIVRLYNNQHEVSSKVHAGKILKTLYKPPKLLLANLMTWQNSKCQLSWLALSYNL